jgi:hypothetical protein
MYQIPIDDVRYHINSPTEKEKLWGREVYEATAKQYEGLGAFVEKTVQPLHLSKSGTRVLLSEISLAFCYAIKVAFPPKTIEQLYRTVKKWMFAFLPYIVENLSVAKPSHLIQYEPKAVVSLYLCNKVFSKLVENNFIEGQDRFDYYYLFELVDLCRSIRSSLLLLMMGDDVHGIALMRGVFEIVAKLSFAQKFSEEYVKFKEFNACLQAHKSFGEELPKEMEEYLQAFPEYRKNREAFLAYGWVKDKKGKRIVTLKGLLKEWNKNERLDGWLQIASEFVHEDYAGVGYDYITMRRALIEYYLQLTTTFFSEELRITLFDKKEIGKIKNLLHAVKSVHGE